MNSAGIALSRIAAQNTPWCYHLGTAGKPSGNTDRGHQQTMEITTINRKISRDQWRVQMRMETTLLSIKPGREAE